MLARGLAQLICTFQQRFNERKRVGAARVGESDDAGATSPLSPGDEASLPTRSRAVCNLAPARAPAGQKRQWSVVTRCRPQIADTARQRAPTSPRAARPPQVLANGPDGAKVPATVVAVNEDGDVVVKLAGFWDERGELLCKTTRRSCVQPASSCAKTDLMRARRSVQQRERRRAARFAVVAVGDEVIPLLRPLFHGVL